ncbi:hypothetical protein [Streptomyces cucumeris]|uniref:hypothetical protein n=1 Tax=Streptomyces cucumeris TaxID=2962890 RepID=UPI003EB73984
MSVVAAYRNGSAWAEPNRWYGRGEGVVAWQPLWKPGGEIWTPGDYEGGRWRIGVSPRGGDTEYAHQLYTALNSG